MEKSVDQAAAMPPDAAKNVIVHLMGPVREMLENELTFLSNVDDYQLIARRENLLEGPDTCDACSKHIFNAHWICTQCGASACIECSFKAQETCVRGGHQPTKAVIHSRPSGIQNLIYAMQPLVTTKEN